jgi:hypothetical protein
MAILGGTTLTGCNSIPSFIPAGTLVLFEQSTAPSSWTRSTGILGGGTGTLRVVSGTVGSGGTLNFPDTFNIKSISGTISAHTLSISEIPAHNHSRSTSPTNIANNPSQSALTQNISLRTPSVNSGFTGGSESHSHPFSASIDFNVRYVDYILASKN